VSCRPWQSAAKESDWANITCNFLYCNHQVHRDFLITLYIHLAKGRENRQAVVTTVTNLLCQLHLTNSQPKQGTTSCSRRKLLHRVSTFSITIFTTTVHSYRHDYQTVLKTKYKILRTRNSGFFQNSSPRMQPQLQTSIAGPYLSSPSSSSGGRYHNVITLLVYGRWRSSALYNRASPKSANLTSPLEGKTIHSNVWVTQSKVTLPGRVFQTVNEDDNARLLQQSNWCITSLFLQT
jgi:hypothetical protein